MSGDSDCNVCLRTEGLPEDHKLQTQFALAAFSTLKADEIIYISEPITSGKRLYAYMDKKGFKTLEEAQADSAAFFKYVVEPNIAAALKVSDAWDKKAEGTVIATVNFEKKLRAHNTDWGQDAFMGMWIPLIKEKVTHMVMVNGWQYSNGAGEEYLQAVLMQMGRGGRRSRIDITDAKGKPIALDQGIELLMEAFRELRRRGLKTRNIAETIAKLIEAENRYNIEKSFNRSAEPDGKTAAHGSVQPYDRKKIKEARKELHVFLAKDYPDILPVLKKTSSFDYSPMNALFSSGKAAASGDCAHLKPA
jgi:hypothetical protein